MGRILQRTAISTNIKERLDFSCALFGPDGGLDYHAPTLTKLPHCLPGQQRTLAIVRSACLVATFIALYTKSSLCWLYSKYFKLSSFWRKQSPRHNSNTVGFSLISLHPYSALSQILSSVPFQCVHTVFLIP